MSFTIERYGVTLRRLEMEDIELVRQWRNDAEVNLYMEYREHITAKMQQKWFESIDNNENLFYVIEYKEEKIGLISTFAIDWNKKHAECGIFVWARKYWQSVVPVFAVLTMLDINFLALGLEQFNVKIHENNIRAKSYNKKLGYEMSKKQGSSMFKHYYLTKEKYWLKSEKLRRIAAKLNGKNTKIIVERGRKSNYFLEKIVLLDEEIIKKNHILLDIT